MIKIYIGNGITLMIKFIGVVMIVSVGIFTILACVVKQLSRYLLISKRFNEHPIIGLIIAILIIFLIDVLSSGIVNEVFKYFW